MASSWTRDHRLALLAIAVSAVVGAPAWFPYVKDVWPKEQTPTVSADPRTVTVTQPTQTATTTATSVPRTTRATRSATHTFPGSWIGTVWIRVGKDGDDGQLSVDLSWGSKHRSETVDLGGAPVYLTTNKNGTDETPIRVDLDRPAEIGFGEGDPPASAEVVSIDRGWTS